MGRSRSLLLPRGSTLSGSEAPSLLPSPPSSRCGSRSKSTMSLAPPSSTESASKHLLLPLVANLIELLILSMHHQNPKSQFDHDIPIFVHSFVKTRRYLT